MFNFLETVNKLLCICIFESVLYITMYMVHFFTIFKKFLKKFFLVTSPNEHTKKIIVLTRLILLSIITLVTLDILKRMLRHFQNDRFLCVTYIEISVTTHEPRYFILLYHRIYCTTFEYNLKDMFPGKYYLKRRPTSLITCTDNKKHCLE